MAEEEKKIKIGTVLRHTMTVVMILLLLAVTAATLVLYVRLISLEERLAEMQPSLDQVNKDVNRAMLELKLLRSSTLQRGPMARQRAPLRPTPTKNVPATVAPTPPSTEKNVKLAQPRRSFPRKTPEITDDTRTPEQAAADFLELLKGVESGTKGSNDVKGEHAKLIRKGEEVVPPLLDSLDDMPDDSASSPYVYGAIRELASQQHKDQILELFETHDALAGTIAELGFREAIPTILAKMKEDKKHSFPLLDSVVKMKIEEGYPLLTDYAVRTGDMMAVRAMAAISEAEYAVTDDLIRVLESRDNWGGDAAGTATAERVAGMLVAKGNQAGLDFLVSQVETGGLKGLERYAQAMLKRSVDYSGQDLERWLPLNAENLQWSEDKRRFTLP